jgi:hypothetical protein
VVRHYDLTKRNLAPQNHMASCLSQEAKSRAAERFRAVSSRKTR